MHAKTKYTELQLICSLIYVKEINLFCQVLKETQKKIGSFFLPHCLQKSSHTWLAVTLTNMN